MVDKKYANPPIIEAVCEFRLTANTKWDLTIPGMIYEKTQHEFPNKEQRLVQEVEIVQSPKGLDQKVHTSERVLFLTNDKKMFIQVGPHLLAVNCLKPYPAWTEFKPRIEKAFQALVSVIEVNEVQRVGLRYINRIEIPGDAIKLEEYFEFRPFLGSGLPQNMSGLIVGCVFLFFDGQDSCKAQLTTAVPEKPENSAFILDLDYFLAKPKSILISQSIEWVERAHEQIQNIFEGCLTPRLRDIFGEVR